MPDFVHYQKEHPVLLDAASAEQRKIPRTLSFSAWISEKTWSCQNILIKIFFHHKRLLPIAAHYSYITFLLVNLSPELITILNILWYFSRFQFRCEGDFLRAMLKIQYHYFLFVFIFKKAWYRQLFLFKY